MSWKETCPMNERLKFIADIQRGEYDMSKVCRMYGVSRKTGYKWWQRYLEAGVDGLKDRSRAPLAHPNVVDLAASGLLIEARKRHPTWGPHKLLAWLKPRYPACAFPVASTVGEILKRQGLATSRRRVRRSPLCAQPLSGLIQPNAVWSADFKGQFRTGDGTWCYPFTLSDGFSRYLLCCRALTATRAALVRPCLERAFRQYGLPLAIRTDNGPPFASTSLGGLSALSVWWIKLGIFPERIAPGHPEQNGRHERLHRTLKQETAKPPHQHLSAQQRAFDRFRAEYNEERPHQALQQRTPSQFYAASSRPYPTRLAEITYPSGFEVRYVRSNGEIKWQGNLLYLSEALIGEPVGLCQIEETQWRVYFGTLALGILDTRKNHVEPITVHGGSLLHNENVLPMCPV